MQTGVGRKAKRDPSTVDQKHTPRRCGAWWRLLSALTSLNFSPSLYFCLIYWFSLPSVHQHRHTHTQLVDRNTAMAQSHLNHSARFVCQLLARLMYSCRALLSHSKTTPRLGLQHTQRETQRNTCTHVGINRQKKPIEQWSIYYREARVCVCVFVFRIRLPTPEALFHSPCSLRSRLLFY